ncbi:hypothetical protein [Arthrobacter sp. EPSL27]|uniref:hypothetical protein n=1 Tax=Arthrobacter sp. EPSL27 TaxID=1745378 RepID=UPI000745F2BE|nr:hypothetical protein [Arthrobacter sp. EPSL27]KUM36924.1 hypothetical protein AR539_06115 [Arthrobacter sp. EPSL27]
MQNRFRLKGASLDEIRRKAEKRHGPAARIVSAERIISPGIAGLFAGDRYEAIIEVAVEHQVVTGEVVPDPDILAETDAPPSQAAKPAPSAASAASAPAGGQGRPPVPPAPAHQLKSAAIAALLEEADAAEAVLHRPGPSGLSTESPDFAELLEQLGAGLRSPSADDPATPATTVAAAPAPATTVAAAPAPATPGAAAPATASAPARLSQPVPTPLSGTGDLVVLVGLGDDALDMALAMSTAAGGADVRTAGKLSAYGHLHVDGRQGATAARAHAVMTDQTVLVAFGLGKARDALARLQSIVALSPDQVWVVVDAGRKPEDSARWVEVLAAQLDITAVAVVGAAETGSPETVNTLGLPVGWIDSGPARLAAI